VPLPVPILRSRGFQVLQSFYLSALRAVMASARPFRPFVHRTLGVSAAEVSTIGNYKDRISSLVLRRHLNVLALRLPPFDVFYVDRRHSSKGTSRKLHRPSALSDPVALFFTSSQRKRPWRLALFHRSPTLRVWLPFQRC
jgi:hypothetical protein